MPYNFLLYYWNINDNLIYKVFTLFQAQICRAWVLSKGTKVLPGILEMSSME